MPCSLEALNAPGHFSLGKNLCKRPFTKWPLRGEICISVLKICQQSPPVIAEVMAHYRGSSSFCLKCVGIAPCSLGWRCSVFANQTRPGNVAACCCISSFLALLVFLCSNSESWEFSNRSHRHLQKSIGAREQGDEHFAYGAVLRNTCKQGTVRCEEEAIRSGTDQGS